MALPSITVTFKEQADSAVARSASGILCLVVKETTASTHTYTHVSALPTDSTYTSANLAAIKRAFVETSPRKVIVVAKSTFPTSAELDNLVFSWIASAESTYQTNIVTYVTGYNTDAHTRRIKGCAVGITSTDDHIVNVASQTVTTADGSLAMAAYIPRIAAVLCACPITESVTYKALADITAVSSVQEADKVLSIVKDDDSYRISRGVMTSGDKTAVIEAKDIIREDIVLTFKNQYLGKKRNSAENQALFCSAVLGYLKDLAVQSVINPDGVISVDVDVDAMRDAWEADGVDVTGLTDAQVRQKPYKSTVFVKATCSILDAIEDLAFTVVLE